MHRPAKISNFEFIILGQKQILGLDISMDDLSENCLILNVQFGQPCMAIDQCIRELEDESSSEWRIEFVLFLLPQYPIDRSAFGIFKQHVHPFIVIEVTIEPKDVWMSENYF